MIFALLRQMWGILRRLSWGNLGFALSWAAFLFPNGRWSVGHISAYFVAVMVGGVVALGLPPIGPWMRRLPRGMLWAAGITALGATLSTVSTFLYRFVANDRVCELLTELPPLARGVLLCLFCCIPIGGGVWSAMALNGYFYQRFIPVVRNWWQSLSRVERVTAVGCVIGLSVLASRCYLQTNAFYAEHYDVVYTTDSAIEAQSNLYLRLVHQENDLRQPLFALAAMPFFGGISLLTAPLQAVAPYAPAVGVGVVQAILVVGAFLLFTHLLGFQRGGERAAALLLLCVGYPSLLFSVQPEQYSVCVAWLFLFLASGRFGVRGFARLRKMAFLAMVGSLVTNGIACLAVLPWWKIRAWKACARWMFGMGMRFILLLSVIMGTMHLWNIGDRIRTYRNFTGETVPFIERFMQWLAFCAMAIRPPEGYLVEGLHEGALPYSWQLMASPAWGIVPGICVLVGCGLAILLCWRQFALKLCAGWAAFSFVLLCLVGWGTAENGLILYELLFGWAFLGMLILLAKRICDGCCPKLFVPLLIIAAGGTLAFSLPAFLEMVTTLSAFWKA